LALPLRSDGRLSGAEVTVFSVDSQPYAGDTVRRIGDPATAAGRALLKDLSPINHAGSITAPLLIYHGAMDTLIPVSHARRMVTSLENNGSPVDYLLFPNEAHGFSQPESEMAVYRAIEMFLHEHLGSSAVKKVSK
jgi:dipeptidyl aminopeptidase/acylaminoacyl peptidase